MLHNALEYVGIPARPHLVHVDFCVTGATLLPIPSPHEVGRHSQSTERS